MKFERKDSLIIAGIFGAYLLFLLYANLMSPNIFWADDLYHVEQSYLLSTGKLEHGIDTWTRPLYAWPCAALIKILGYNLESCRLITIFSAAISLAILYSLILHFTSSRKLALLGVGLLAIIPMHIMIATSNLTQAEFQLFFLLGIWLLVKKRTALSALAIGLLPLIRDEGRVIVLIWAIYYLLPAKQKYKSFKDIIPFARNTMLLFAPFLLWCIAAQFVAGNFFLPFKTYPFVSPYPPLAAHLYLLKTAYNLGAITSLLFAISLIKFREFEPELKLALAASLVVLFLQVLFSHFGLFGTIGATEYLVPYFPVAMLSAARFLKTLKINEKHLAIICIIILAAQAVELYSWKFSEVVTWGHGMMYDRAVFRPLDADTMQYMQLSDYFYREILPKNEAVQLCGLQIIRNFDKDYARNPIQIMFQHNNLETPEICPNCVYSDKPLGRTWVLWNPIWCAADKNEIVDSSYELVKSFGEKLVFRHA